MAMPEAPTDWRHEARTLLAAGYGQNEAARKLGVPPERLKKWAQRSGINKSIQATLARVSPMMSPRDTAKLSPIVPAATVMADDAERLGPEARHVASRIAYKSLLHVENTVDADPELGLVQLDSALTAGKLLRTANARGWEAQPATQENHSHLHLHQAIRPDQP